ncbi:hypothetical protein [Petroclostridium sp. X23]|uniref:hypothetical protein n=1 Tax=Petroclostridium sp. X23 TaxID=3045146 RepID=UPI0024AC9DF2|nr:hypothetical protein [Petroclostridium sp. X23]WHH59169.1 hypothetical protein QKW49_25845 [Petroclostridium sp. X23]
MFYLWTVELNQPEEKFWKKTLRQIYHLLEHHRQFNTVKDPEDEEVFIDQI